MHIRTSSCSCIRCVMNPGITVKCDCQFHPCWRSCNPLQRKKIECACQTYTARASSRTPCKSHPREYLYVVQSTMHTSTSLILHSLCHESWYHSGVRLSSSPLLVYLQSFASEKIGMCMQNLECTSIKSNSLQIASRGVSLQNLCFKMHVCRSSESKCICAE